MSERTIPGRVPLLGDERGVSVIEFGVLAPILGFMLLGMVDLANGYTRKMAVENAVNRAMEKVAVLAVQDDYNFLKTEVAGAMPGITASTITVETYAMCDTTRMPSFKSECGFRADGTPEQISRYVKLKVADRWSPMFNYGISGYKLYKTGTDGKVPLTVETQLRVQ